MLADQLHVPMRSSIEPSYQSIQQPLRTLAHDDTRQHGGVTQKCGYLTSLALSTADASALKHAPLLAPVLLMPHVGPSKLPTDPRASVQRCKH